MKKPTLLRLPNGLRVVLVDDEGTETVTTLALFKVGSRYEPAPIAGTAHFLEHMMFKGTRRRPNTIDISRELDAVGADYNAFTGKDHTGYYIKAASGKLSLALDVLADMLSDSLFADAEIVRERRVVCEEINMYEDNPLIFLDDLFERTIFGGETNLGRSIAGSKRTVRKLSRADLLSFRDRYYRGHNGLLVLAGRLPAKVRSLVSRAFRKFPDHGRRSSFAAHHHPVTRPTATIKFKETEQVHLALGVPAPSLFDRRLPTLSVLSTILGGTMSSRLFIRIRERMGLAYSVKTSLSTYEDTGALMVEAGLDRRRVDEAIAAILDELGRIRRELVTDEELSKAKEYIRGRVTIDLEDTEAQAVWYGKQFLLARRLETPAERFRKIFKVRAEDVRSLSRELFRRNRLNLAVIGPFRERRRFTRLLGSFGR